MKLSRRQVLKGIGGATLSLPLLESFAPRTARAQEQLVEPYAIFFRQACGVAAAQSTGEIGAEPERFWPTTTGALTPETLQGRALDELVDYRDRLLVVGNVNYGNFNYGDGHARGAMQGLTGRPPVVDGAGGDSEASGESIDHRIGRELNPDGRDSLFMYAGTPGGWLGGPCISYRSGDVRRAAFHNPRSAYDAVAGLAGGNQTPEVLMRLQQKQQSINDLVRDQMNRLLGNPGLSQSDRDRLQLHFDSIRELEVQISCQADQSVQSQLDGAGAIFESGDGDNVWAVTRLHMDVAVLAVACGYTRSVAIQIGSGNDGGNRYRDPDTGQLMENYHYISHRRLSHDASGAVIAGSDLLHHKVDRQFAQAFKYLLDRLSAYTMPDGNSLLEHGVSAWYNDNGNGPAHATNNVPWILAGSAGGFLRQGQYVRIGTQGGNISQVHNTIGSAAGVRTAQGGYLEDFGDPSLPRGVLPELMT
jgi:hypothetical protein